MTLYHRRNDKQCPNRNGFGIRGAVLQVKETYESSTKIENMKRIIDRFKRDFTETERYPSKTVQVSFIV